MKYTQREKELLAALVETAKALGRLIDQQADQESPEIEILERAFETVGNHSTENLFGLSVEEMAMALKKEGFFVGGLPPEGIKYYYNKITSAK